MIKNKLSFFLIWKRKYIEKKIIKIRYKIIILRSKFCNKIKFISFKKIEIDKP